MRRSAILARNIDGGLMPLPVKPVLGRISGNEKSKSQGKDSRKPVGSRKRLEKTRQSKDVKIREHTREKNQGKG